MTSDDLKAAEDLTQRLKCKYAIGPMIDGEPEFGWRDMSGPMPAGVMLPTPLDLEAAALIRRLVAEIERLEKAIKERELNAAKAEISEREKELKRASRLLVQTLEDIFSGTSFLNQKALLQYQCEKITDALVAYDEEVKEKTR
ncbi:MAG: hypothetical protein ACYC9K_01180 [Sulfuricaulis sp.]